MASTPETIAFDGHIFDFTFHPNNNVVAAGLITGDIQCYTYSTQDNHQQWRTKASKKSCRAIEFNHDGTLLLSVSRDKSIQTLDAATGKMLIKMPKAHKHPINKLCNLSPFLSATGDDEGVVRFWDMRTCKMAQETRIHDDFVADMVFCESKHTMLVAGGDGTLSAHDIRKLSKTPLQSDIMDDEMLSLAIVKDGQQVVAGSQSGTLYTWEWGNWKRASDRWIGHPCSVDTMCKLDEQTICTGGNDGLLRLISLDPQQFQGVIGDHGQDFPLERVRVTHDQNFIGSCGHDMQLRFWEIQSLFEQDSEDETEPVGSKRKIDDDHDDSDKDVDVQMKRPKPRAQFFDQL